MFTKISPMSKMRQTDFLRFRDDGIYMQNLNACQQEHPKFAVQKRAGGDILHCAKCNKFIARKGFYKHRKLCQGSDTSYPNMFDHEHFGKLRKAVTTMTSKEDSEDGIKYGLKNNLFYLLMATATYVKGLILGEERW